MDIKPASMEYSVVEDNDNNDTINFRSTSYADDGEIDQFTNYKESRDIIESLYDQYNVSGKYEKFRCILVCHSNTKIDYSKITDEEYNKLLSQWNLYARTYNGAKKRRQCICCQNLTDLRYVINKENQNILLVGNKCINKFAKQSKLAHSNNNFTNFLNKVCKKCEKCSVKKYAIEMKGGYCLRCYDKRDKSKQRVLDKKKVCISCLNFRVIKNIGKRCNTCRQNNNHPMLIMKEKYKHGIRPQNFTLYRDTYLKESSKTLILNNNSDNNLTNKTLNGVKIIYKKINGLKHYEDERIIIYDNNDGYKETIIRYTNKPEVPINKQNTDNSLESEYTAHSIKKKINEGANDDNINKNNDESSHSIDSSSESDELEEMRCIDCYNVYIGEDWQVRCKRCYSKYKNPGQYIPYTRTYNRMHTNHNYRY